MDKPTDKHQHLRSRQRARRLAMQALYQRQVTDLALDEVVEQFRCEESFGKADADYFTQLLRGGAEHSEEIKSKLRAIAGYDLDQVDPVERSILLNAAYEILFVPDVDKAVAITEAVHLAKKFGAAEGYRFINGVLDKL